MLKLKDKSSFSFFVAYRLYKDTDGGKKVSRPAVLIAMTGIALGMAIMLITISVVIGFKSEVRNKVIGFGSHIQISNLDALRSYETRPVVVGDSLCRSLLADPEVVHVERYSTKPGIIKTEEAFLGMVLRGVGQEFDDSFYRKHLVEGEIPNFTDSVASREMLISKDMADKLKLKLGDKVMTYYIQDNVRVRPLTVKGIFQTNFSEYDNLFVLTDLYTVNRLNRWKEDQVSGALLKVADFDRLYEVAWRLSERLDNVSDGKGGTYYVQDIEQLNPQIFGWLQLLDINVWVILALMLGVAGFTMISGLLIIIIERTSMIGILKALGCNNFTVRKVFLWFATFLIGKGMLLGNIIGLTCCFLQEQFHLVKLDPENYYVDSVPVSFQLWWFLLLNVGMLLISVLMLVGPSYLITKINPSDSMRYE